MRKVVKPAKKWWLAATLVVFVVVAGVLGYFWMRFSGAGLHNRGLDQLVTSYVPPGAATPSGESGPVGLPQHSTVPLPKSVRVPILLYHYVEYNHDPKDTIRIGLTVTPFWFEKQLQYLIANGYQTVTLDEVQSAIRGWTQLPPKPVVLTFDDGYRDFYTDAWPVLLKYHEKATTFIVPDFLDKINYMFSWQVSQIATESGGLITIGAHTRHHLSLPSLPADKAWDEIFGSKMELEQKFSVPVTDFAYPYGSLNLAVQSKVIKAGFLTAVSTIFGETEGKDNMFYLPRIRVGNYDGVAFENRLEGK